MIGWYYDKPLIDKTGLKNGFEVTLDIGIHEWKAMMRAAGAPCAGPGCSVNNDIPADPSGASLRESIRRLGLRVVSERDPVDTIVVDRIERKPAEN
jgi:uncharacterized protein (TIGR03435 family)